MAKQLELDNVTVYLHDSRYPGHQTVVLDDGISEIFFTPEELTEICSWVNLSRTVSSQETALKKEIMYAIED